MGHEVAVFWNLGSFLLAVVLGVLLLDVIFGFKFSSLLLVLPAVPLDLHAVVDSVLVSGHVLHISKPLPTKGAGEVPDSKVDRHAVTVEIKLPLEFLAAVWTRPLGQLSVNHPDVEVQSGDGLLTERTEGPDTQVHGLPVGLHRLLVVERPEAVRALEELPLGPAQVVGLDVDGAGVLVLELPLAHGAGHRHVLLPVRVVRLEVHRLELLQLGVSLSPVTLESSSVVEYLVTPAHPTGQFDLLRVFSPCSPLSSSSP